MKVLYPKKRSTMKLLRKLKLIMDLTSSLMNILW